MKRKFPVRLSILHLLLVACTAACQKPVNDAAAPSATTVGGPFENAEFMYIGMPTTITATDTSPGWNQQGQRLLIKGTIMKNDGRTPAPGVTLYYYHTDVNGLYSDDRKIDRKLVRHGYIRGWVKSDENGRYAIYTVRPAPYPNADEPAHIHPAIKEPNINEYYIDEFVFDDDPLLTAAKRKAMQNRGGSGVLRTHKENGIEIAEHNIILGLNIPDYPSAKTTGIASGKEIGEDLMSFMPYHATGADKGTTTCPICKYGKKTGILYFVGNKPDWNEIAQWLVFFEKQVSKYIKVFFVYGNNEEFDKQKTIRQLENIANELGLTKTALTLVPSFDDKNSEIYLNKINPDAENTILLYKQSNVFDKYVNAEPTQENFDRISNSLSKAMGYKD